MKFSSEDLMKAMGLSVGDRIRVCDKAISATFEVTNDYGLFRLDNVDIPNARTGYELHHIFGLDFEILPRPKRVGELKCDNFECCDCPLQYICCLDDWGFTTNDNLFNILELFDCDDQEIYDLLKARLDKEVKQDE